MLLLLPGTASAAFGTTIVERFWDAFMSLFLGRIQSEVPIVLPMLQEAEKLILGPTADLSLNPAVLDVFSGMRTGGMFLLAFCTVISLAEVAESGIMGAASGLTNWFKRFLVATLMTFGSIHVYALWIRLFNALVHLLQTYLDSHWSGPATTGALYQTLVNKLVGGDVLLVLAFVLLTLLVLLLLAFLVGGVRVAELILSIVIAPIVWPIYLIPSMDDIPKTAFRGFLGLNALLLFTVAMVRTAVRLATAPGMALNIWSMVPALSLLMMSIFLPATVKRIVGQGHTGVGALATLVNMASGLKFLALGVGAAAAAPAAAGAALSAPAGSSAYPLATLSTGSAMTGAPNGGAMAGVQTPPIYEARVSIPQALSQGRAAAQPLGLEAPPNPNELCIDLGESRPGSGRFDTVLQIERMSKGPGSPMRDAKEERKR